jgi:hypothetical protein
LRCFASYTASLWTAAYEVAPAPLHSSPTIATEFQSILHDLRATELAMRVLKLPLRRVPQPPNPETGKLQMDLAADTGRRQLFGQVYAFLHHLAAVETPTGALIHNTKIQVRPSFMCLPLLLETSQLCHFRPPTLNPVFYDSYR